MIWILTNLHLTVLTPQTSPLDTSIYAPSGSTNTAASTGIATERTASPDAFIAAMSL